MYPAGRALWGRVMSGLVDQDSGGSGVIGPGLQVGQVAWAEGQALPLSAGDLQQDTTQT